MRKGLLCGAALFAAHSFASAQEVPKFEVASVRECEAVKGQRPSISSPGRLRLVCWPLTRLIAEAYETFADGKVDSLKAPYGIPPEGAPAWANNTSYTIDAEAAGPQSGAMMRGPMMQALLEDRFRVKVHREAREISGYLMTVDKGGLKMKATQEGSCDRVDPTDLAQTVPPMPCGVPKMSSDGPLRVLDLRGVTMDV